VSVARIFNFSLHVGHVTDGGRVINRFLTLFLITDQYAALFWLTTVVKSKSNSYREARHPDRCEREPYLRCVPPEPLMDKGSREC
jgi:hypothetical protein